MTNLIIALGLVSVARFAQGELSPAARKELPALLARALAVPWRKIAFPIDEVLATRGREIAQAQLPAGADEEAEAKLLFDALALFADIAEEAPEEATQDVLEALIVELAATVTLTQKPISAPPHLFRDGMLQAVFQPHALTEEVAKQLNMQPVLYRGVNGAQLRGLLFLTGGRVLLETGEYLALPETPDYRVLPVDEWFTLPAGLPAYAVVFADELLRDGAIDAPAHHALRDTELFGKFIAPRRVLAASQGSVKSLQMVFDTHRAAAKIGAVGATGPAGTTLRLLVAGAAFQIVVDASADTRGLYVTARLLDADEVILRVDRPRENSWLGVYAFPVVGADDRIRECVFLKVL